MDWKTQLAEFIEGRKNKPFKWGYSDCCMFAADAWRCICRIDLAEWFRGKYRSEKKATELLQEFAGGGLSKTMTKLARQYKLQKIERPFIQNGDMCLVKTELGDAMGIAWNGKILAQGPKALVVIPRSEVKRAWRHKKLGE